MPVITTTDELTALCERLKGEEFITIDTEFLREKTYFPKLCLIQIGDKDKNAKAIDPLADGIDLSPLYEILDNENILKIFHAGRQDLEIFYHATGKVVRPIFDTQIAAMVCGFGDSIGYDKLVRHVSNVQIDKSAQFTDWSLRPLSEKQVDYALGDVTHLVDVYNFLRAKLKETKRCEWLTQEKAILEDPQTYNADPMNAWERIKVRSAKPKMLAVLREVAAWRESRAQKRDIPKNWIMRDETLVDMAHQAPQNKKQLAKIRNLSKDILEGRGAEKLLDAIQKAINSPQENWPKIKKKEPTPPHVIATIDVLKMLLKLQSVEHEVAAKIIASTADLEAIALSDDADIPALKGWRKEVFGQAALDLKHGRLAIGLKNGKITKYPVEHL